MLNEKKIFNVCKNAKDQVYFIAYNKLRPLVNVTSHWLWVDLIGRWRSGRGPVGSAGRYLEIQVGGEWEL